MANKKIVVVDDDKGFLEELRENLAMSGYEIIAVNNPALVLSIVKKEKPDIVLLDLKMPGKSGFQLADEIRGIYELHNVPIIAMSAYFKEEYRMLMNVCGIKKCLKKPFNPLDIISEIESAAMLKQT